MATIKLAVAPRIRSQPQVGFWGPSAKPVGRFLPNVGGCFGFFRRRSPQLHVLPRQSPCDTRFCPHFQGLAAGRDCASLAVGKVDRQGDLRLGGPFLPYPKPPAPAQNEPKNAAF